MRKPLITVSADRLRGKNGPTTEHAEHLGTFGMLHAAVTAIWRELDLDAIDIRRAFAQDGNPQRFRYYPGSHYDEAGHAFLAQRVLARLPAAGTPPTRREPRS